MESGRKIPVLGHRPALDGLRGVAILLVFFGHLAIPGFDDGGGVGVNLFFVLSGFLITTILLEELDRRGRIAVWRFYARRALRLLPALLVVVAVVAGYTIVTGTESWPAVFSVLLYIGNWNRIAGGDTYVLGTLSHTWSLAVEEQFYIVWPLVLIVLTAVVRDRRRLLVAFVVLAVAIVLWRTWLWETGASLSRVYIATDTRADALLLGAATAVAFTLGILRRPRFAWVAIAGAALWAISVPSDSAAAALPGLRTFEVTASIVIAELAGVVLIARAVSAPWALLSGRVIRWFGKVSYGLYLWHVPIIVMLNIDTPVKFWTAIVLSLAAAAVSWRFVERPALGLSSRVAWLSRSGSRIQAPITIPLSEAPETAPAPAI
jgi:peptidoglycan/LPS O-acetylase OafA/YrhL